MTDALDIVRLRHVGVREWSIAKLLSIKRVGSDRIQLEIDRGEHCECFVAGTSVEVHLPLGGCFVALLEAVVPGFLFGLKVLEFLDPAQCADDLEHFGSERR
jgi:hypothetical protein